MKKRNVLKKNGLDCIFCNGTVLALFKYDF